MVAFLLLFLLLILFQSPPSLFLTQFRLSHLNLPFPSSLFYLFSLWLPFALVIIESLNVKKSVASGAFVMEKVYDYLRALRISPESFNF
jgi:hypothetical protein